TTPCSPAMVEVYDIRGNIIATPFNIQAQQGIAEGKESCARKTHEVCWTPDETISSGIYFVKAKTDDGHSISKKIIYLK
ncbi:T9SS type A sorting domain-containing protein, partial [bacterium]|nr:T9SS type A sorting domain-containing protein [bacterium]